MQSQLPLLQVHEPSRPSTEQKLPLQLASGTQSGSLLG
jgi:hypothetical protein